MPRTQHREPLNRPCTLQRQDLSGCCQVLDISSEGLGIQTDLPVAIGDILTIQFAIDETISLTLTLRVSHISHQRIGGPLSPLAPVDAAHLAHYLTSRTRLELEGF